MNSSILYFSYQIKTSFYPNLKTHPHHCPCICLRLRFSIFHLLCIYIYIIIAYIWHTKVHNISPSHTWRDWIPPSMPIFSSICVIS